LAAALLKTRRGPVPKNKTIDPRLGEYVSQAEFGRMIGKTPRTISRWMSGLGLPYVTIGREIFIPLEPARNWLADRVANLYPNRKGRR
jgi:hypothetical protein